MVFLVLISSAMAGVCATEDPAPLRVNPIERSCEDGLVLEAFPGAGILAIDPTPVDLDISLGLGYAPTDCIDVFGGVQVLGEGIEDENLLTYSWVVQEPTLSQSTPYPFQNVRHEPGINDCVKYKLTVDDGNHKYNRRYWYEAEAPAVREAMCDPVAVDTLGTVVHVTGLPMSVWNGANLGGQDLSSLSLVGFDFRAADLRGANLSGADLSDANLQRAVFTLASFDSATLSGADLAGAYLFRPWFVDANLADASFANGFVGTGNFTNADLTGANFADIQFKTPLFANTTCPTGVVSDACGSHQLEFCRSSAGGLAP